MPDKGLNFNMSIIKLKRLPISLDINHIMESIKPFEGMLLNF